MRTQPHLETDLAPRGTASTGASSTSPAGITVTWAEPDEPLPPMVRAGDRDVLLSWRQQALSEIVSDLQWRVTRLLNEVERTPVR